MKSFRKTKEPRNKLNLKTAAILVAFVCGGIANIEKVHAAVGKNHFECAFPDHDLNAAVRNIEFELTPKIAPTEGEAGGVAYINRGTPLEKTYRFMILHRGSPDLGNSTLIVPDVVQEKNRKLSPQIHIHLFGSHFLPGGSTLTVGTGIAAIGESVTGNKNNLILVLDTSEAHCL